MKEKAFLNMAGLNFPDRSPNRGSLASCFLTGTTWRNLDTGRRDDISRGLDSVKVIMASSYGESVYMVWLTSVILLVLVVPLELPQFLSSALHTLP